VEVSAAFDFERDGCAIVDDVLPARSMRAVERVVGGLPCRGAGSRSLLRLDWCQAVARRLAHHAALRRCLDHGDLAAVQCTLFHKHAGCNWSVPPHRDLHIAVAERVEHRALVGWSRKQGEWFVQAPRSLLRRLVAVRLHVDGDRTGGGALRVAPGSHRLGAAGAEPAPLHEALIARGGALVMRPLLIHASHRAVRPGQRRVLHFLFGPRDLPFGLRWALAVG
jgi:hypothetical protein